MKNHLGFTSFNLMIVLLVLVGGCGWIANIVKRVGSNFDPLTGMVVARAIGIFVAPLGAVLGFL
jgi:hypothetical protein